jgi:predicted SAM-dependent methyltransferase
LERHQGTVCIHLEETIIDMSYTFPFHGKIIELGGGDNPYFRPNLDVRSGDKVDIVADFNKELPIPAESYDGVFSSYCIEHISWRKVRLFISEVHRILRPKGKAVFITANTKRQMEWVLSHDEWNDDCSSIIFGDQNYDENTHRNSLSPTYAIKLLREAGFEGISVLPHGALGTDMIIEVTKPEKDDRKALFDKHYFNGGAKVGGYAYEGYWDYPVHWVTYDKVMEHKPHSVLEIGAARGYMVKRFIDAGIISRGLEISHHCQLTRVTDAVIEWDICQTPWPFRDKEFDLAFSTAVFEHIPEDKLADIIRELDRVCQRGLHGIDFGHNDDGFDKTHCTLKPKEWWADRMPKSHIVCDKEELEHGNMTLHIPYGDDKLKVNFGSFINMFHHGWINTDIIGLQDFANRYRYKFIPIDATQRFPFNDNTIDLAYCSHMLEHLTAAQGEAFLREVHRCMKSGSTIRLAVPDAERLINYYNNKQLSMFDEVNDDCSKTQVESIKLWSLLFEGHKVAYDFDALKSVGEKVGFVVEKKNFTQGHQQIVKETIDMLPEISLYIEMRKL